MAEISEPTSTSSFGISSLPDEVIRIIAIYIVRIPPPNPAAVTKRMHNIELLSLAAVSRRMHDICCPLLWEVCILKNDT